MNFSTIKAPFIFVALVVLFLCSCHSGSAEKNAVILKKKSGKLFIIGGGDRTPELMRSMIQQAGLNTRDYIAVLPMAGEEPDSSFWYFQQDVPSSITCVNLNFSDVNRNVQSMTDSLKKAKLIFICGGDQNRFMQVVEDRKIASWIIDVYNNGGMIAGTSAGAAVMSDVMITGNQSKDTAYSATYALVESHNAIYSKGLGFIQNGIVDQHFVTRSRYNRLISALVDHPKLSYGLGVEEETAALIENDQCTVIGKGPIILMTPKKKIKMKKETIDEAFFEMGIFGTGQRFRLP
jgi:cyanophycinase